ncbi:thaumatin-like protein 1 [Punica granatum]|nr:thaumatin-like protein 1 [Punica granatum]
MAKFPFLISALVVMFSPLLFIRGVEPTTFTVVNKCDYTVWPGILANAGKPAVSTTSFALQKGEFRAISPRTNAGRPSEAETRRGR